LVPRVGAFIGPPQRKDSVAWLDSDIAAWAESRTGPPVEGDIALAHTLSQFTVGVMLDRNLNTGDDCGVDE
jgi:hypothetical protein